MKRALTWSIFRILQLVLLIRLVDSYNIDETLPVIKKGETGSLFGLSVSLHHIIDGAGAKQSKLLVGAPMAGDPDGTVGKIGGLFTCPVSSDQNDCEVLPLDKNDENSISTVGQWLGVTVKTEKPGGRVAVCAHRWNGYSNKSTEVRNSYIDALFGKCYILYNDLSLVEDFSPMTPCSDFGKNGNLRIENHRYCQAGMSFAFSQQKETTCAYYGMPGSYVWTGSLAAQDLNTDFFTNLGWKHVRDTELISMNINFNSYLGFSVATGYLSDGISVSVVGGPRANSTGSVVVFRTNITEMTYHSVIAGEKVASAFGYTVEMFDIDNDGYQDIIVGAPQYYDRTMQRGGAVYVYRNLAIDGITGGFGAQPFHVFYGDLDSSFGNSVANCGDINMDGVDDLAIGAPNAMDGSGVVYIYHGLKGSKDQFSEKPSQVIFGKSLSENGLLDQPLSGFGYSLSGGMDMDDNGYPDLMVGSLSDSAVLYRTRPIVTVKPRVTTDMKLIRFPESPQKEMQSFKVNVCMEYKSIPKYNEPVEIGYTLLLDRINKINERRVTFDPTQDTDTHEGRLMIKDQSDDDCEEVDVFIKQTVVDKLSPINIKLSYELLETSSRRKRDVDSPVPSLSGHPIMNQDDESEISIDLEVAKNCGPDDVCRSNLQMKVEYVEMGDDGNWNPVKRNEADVPTLVMAKDRTLGILFEISNLGGEGAHQANLTVSLPFGLDFERISPDQKIHSASDRYVNVNLGNPFEKDASVSFLLDFTGNRSLLNGDEVTTAIELQTSSTQDRTDFGRNLTAVIQIEGHIEVLPNSDPFEISPSGKVIGESAVKSPTDVGQLFVHSFELKNEGTTNLQDLEFEISWPAQLENGKWLFYFVTYSTESTTGDIEVHCDVPEDLNPLGLKLPDGDDTAASRRKRRDADESAAKSLEQIQPRLRPPMTNSTDIVCPGYSGCVSFKCTVPEIPTSKKVIFMLHGVVWNSTFLEEYENQLYTVSVATDFRLINTEKAGVKFTDASITKAHAVTEVLSTSAFIPDSQGTNIWVVAAAALAGIILLVLLILILWCCGFFRRKRDFGGGYHKARYHKQASKKAEERSDFFN